MKNIMPTHNRKMLLALAVVFAALLFGSANQAWAQNGNQIGYYDHGDNYHRYGYYHRHSGYWNNYTGVRVWINVG